MSTDPDVIVIGAGLSGLWAARTLQDRGRNVRVIEARDRVGGRTLTRQIGGAAFDFGAQWIGPGQTRMYALVKSLGLETFVTHSTGKKVLDLDEKAVTYSGTIPKLSPWKLLTLGRAIARIERQCRSVPLDDATLAKTADAWDAETVETYKRSFTKDPAVHALLDAAVRTIFGADAREISMLYFMWYLHSGGGLMSLIQTKDGAQQDRLVLGTQTIAIRLADALADVVLDAPVVRIEHDADGVTVHTGGAGKKSDVHRARHLIVAIPPHLAGRIEYAPPLPARRDQLTQRTPMGATIKALATYDTPFWRADGFAGEGVSDGNPISAVFDATSNDGSQPALLGFIVGEPARRWGARPVEARRSAVIETFTRMFGAAAAAPTGYYELDWAAEPFSGGCPVAFMGTGTMAALSDVLRAPIGRIHWAGTETATEWCGYMEGALSAGERAAEAVLDAGRP